MKAFGNGQPEVCAYNLLQTFRGEVPYERLKGIDASSIDTPASLVDTLVESDARWVLETYEPRIDVNEIEFNVEDAIHGNFSINSDITKK